MAVTSLLGGLVLGSCSGSEAQLGKPASPGGESPSSPAGETSDELATVSMALVNVPNDALCLELAVTPTVSTWGGRTQLFDITPGTSPTLTLNGLPSGSASLAARSFGVPCAQVQASTSPTWVSAGPVPVTLVAGQPVSTSVVLLRPGSVQVTATFNDGTPTLTPSTKDFGGVQVGGTVTSTFTVTNPGTAAVTLSAPTITGTDSTQFQVLQNGCPASLPSSATCTIDVVFKPTTGGNKAASLSMGSLSASLSGTALVSILTITPSPANFPNTPVGSTTTVTLTLSNGSSTALSLGSWAITGGTEFGYGTTTCGASLPASASCTQVMTFAPLSAGTKTATLSSSAGTSVTLNGIATSSTLYRINCGSSTAVSPFAADQYFSGGSQSFFNNNINLSGVTNPAPAAVYQTERYGNSTYTFPNLTASAPYTVRLHFAELYWNAAGRRLFNVAINGTAVLSRIDLYATTGGQYRAYVRDFTTNANSSGQIVVTFSSITDNASISGIEIIATCAPSCTGKCGGADGCGGTCPSCTCPSGTKNCNGTCIPTSACCSNSDCAGGKTCNASNQCVCAAGMKDCNGTCIPSTGCCSNADCSAGNTCNTSTHQCGCQASPPSLTISPLNQSACAGQSPSLTVSATQGSGAGFNYQWYKVGQAAPLANGADYAGVTTATLTVTNAKSTGINSDKYYCVVSDAGCGGTSNSATSELHVFESPTMTGIQNDSRVIGPYMLVAFETTVMGGLTPYEVIWYRDGTSLGSGMDYGSGSYAFAGAATCSATGAYYALVRDANHCEARTNIAQLQMTCSNGGPVCNATLSCPCQATPPTVTVSPQTQNACSGQSPSITVSAAGSGAGLTYQWYKVGQTAPLANGTDYAGVTTATLTVRNVKATGGNSDRFYCIVTDLGCGGASTIGAQSELRVLAPPTVSAIQNESYTYGPYGLYAFEVAVSGGSSPYEFTYFKDGVAAGAGSDTGNSSFVYRTAMSCSLTGSYYGQVKDANNCTAQTNTATLTITGCH